MRTGLIIFGIVIVVAAVAAIQRHSVIEELRDQNASLKVRTEEIAELENEVAHLRSIEIDTNALEKLRGETMELMRLRAKVSRLRPIADKPDAELQREVRQSESVLQTAKAGFDHEAKFLVEYRTSQLQDAIASTLCRNINGYVAEHERFPDSLEPFRQNLSELLNQDRIRRENTSGLPEEYLAQITGRLEDFELMTPPEDFASTDTPYFILREKTPRKLLNGKWQRTYGCVENVPGKLGILTTPQPELEDGNFEQWEQKFLNR